jgi:hypothetical protein
MMQFCADCVADAPRESRSVIKNGMKRCISSRSIMAVARHDPGDFSQSPPIGRVNRDVGGNM